MDTMMKQDRDWRYEWLKRTVERMDEFEKRGEENITLQTREFQRIIMELLAMHQRCDRLEEVLCSYARYAFPVSQRIEPPAMFGIETFGRFSSTHESNTPQAAEHCHIFVTSGNGYNVCADTDRRVKDRRVDYTSEAWLTGARRIKLNDRRKAKYSYIKS